MMIGELAGIMSATSWGFRHGKDEGADWWRD
jgi:hypothetical protein